MPLRLSMRTQLPSEMLRRILGRSSMVRAVICPYRVPFGISPSYARLVVAVVLCLIVYTWFARLSYAAALLICVRAPLLNDFPPMT